MTKDYIRIRGARQNNLKGLNIDLPLNELIVITGVSGSGKSSLAFDTIYSEGQRRYVETFSPYARQFLDRMDKPKVESIEGIPPAIAIDQTNPVRTSRSTVGTMTEINDHLKLLFARAARLYCRKCGIEVRRDTPDDIYQNLRMHFSHDAEKGVRIAITFPIDIPKNFTGEEIEGYLAGQGYTRIHSRSSQCVEVIQDRLRFKSSNRARIIEDFEAALEHGKGRVTVRTLESDERIFRFSLHLHCANCDIYYDQPSSNSFSFNSALGACQLCRGFGRTMGIDHRLVIPDERKTLAEGAIKPLQSKSYLKRQQTFLGLAQARGIPVDVPWGELTTEHREWIWRGEGARQKGVWYGLDRFFAWLERKSYRMHIRVLLSKYRSYDLCAECRGSRLKAESLLWRLGSLKHVEKITPVIDRFRHPVLKLDDMSFSMLPGFALHDIMLLPISDVLTFFNDLRLSEEIDDATSLLLEEIRSRLNFLSEVGLGYLTLDRQSRTLSGGEVQRINLTTALGTSLVNALFVLDEPSIGLHPRDMGHVIRVLHRLRDVGNTLIVVEHDAQVMLSADRVLDLGPGPGSAGGEIVFDGTPRTLLKNKRSVTAQFLRNERQMINSRSSRRVDERCDWIEVLGATQHNLKNINVRIPLRRLVCVTGVSGSGKSTLIQEVLFNALTKLKGSPKDIPGDHAEILGDEYIDNIVSVNQAPIGRTTRSNPASFVGVLDSVRKQFAKEPLALQRGYTASTFSFNSGNGRCATCSGKGFEHIEMQFLSDVYIRCGDCKGDRFRPEILEVKLHKRGAKSIADVLRMTVAEAMDYFAKDSAVIRGLQPLDAVGLDYLTLGQPVPTLSGGEAQRLKLAGHLAKARKRAKEPTLFIFDEPTTGLHFSDVEKLLLAISELIEQGHSVVVIEHNLDVIGYSDWIIDLGPGGGVEGGYIVGTGSPDDLADMPKSHTGRALAAWSKSADTLISTPSKACVPARKRSCSDIKIVHARENNLKNIDISIPRDQLTVITGVSGSGKSTVAFDLLFAEGQRRYLESLNAYARQFVQPASRADADAVLGIPPTVAIGQRVSRGGRKSTVATLTEIYHFLRLLFVKLGAQSCPDCKVPIHAQSFEAILSQLLSRYRGRKVVFLSPLVVGRKGYYAELAKWADSNGFKTLRVDGEFLSTSEWPKLDRFQEHDIELSVGEISVVPENEQKLDYLLKLGIQHGAGMVQVLPLDSRGKKAELFSVQRACPSCNRSFQSLDPRLFSYNSKYGWCNHCFGMGVEVEGFDDEQTGEEPRWLEGWEDDLEVCHVCAGSRLRPEALAVSFKGSNVAEYTALSVTHALKRFKGMRLDKRERQIARDVLEELKSRLKFLEHIGLGYLFLDRAAPTLSGGEAQRIRLAAQLGSNLRGVCYILDEPTIGLHPRDNDLLLDTMEQLTAKGNTVVVVEHDEETIRRADHIIDLGPGAGVRGGEMVAAGKLSDILASPCSLTGQMMKNPLVHPVRGKRRRIHNDKLKRLHVIGAKRYNLRDVDLELPLGVLTCVTGVSGSGKSTLIQKVLFENLKLLLARKLDETHLFGCKRLEGWQVIDRILEVDQKPIGKTPRSCPATYIGVWDEVRRLFSKTPEARLRGYGPGRFSFNVAGGRCENCEGQGSKKIAMNFLPDVRVGCDQCNGGRFNSETLEVRYGGKNIAQILEMSVDEAVNFFEAHPKLSYIMQLLQDVGLGYLTLGQQSPTLSGGEAQRIKLVTELSKARPRIERLNLLQRHTLYVLDEPTIGLHMADIEKLIKVLHRLVDAGNTVVVIEHNLDLIAEADWIVDMGPDGGDAGGRIVAQGALERVMRRKRGSHTTKALTKFMNSPMSGARV